MPTIKNIAFQLDQVYMIASLKGNHLQSAKDLYNYQIPFEKKQFIEINSKDEFINALIRIEKEAEVDSGPLIHVEAHGLDSNDGISLSNGIELSNGDCIYWEELRPYLITINSKCNNNLSIVMASCFGVYIIKDLIQSFFDDIISSVCPFFCFVGPESYASVDDFINAFPVFYKTIYTEKSFISAVLEMNKNSSVRFRCDNSYNIFESCSNSFADKQIKHRFKYILENPDLVNDYYCQLYYYTYGSVCDMNAVISIMKDESFYLDYLNKRRREFLHVNDVGFDRFPVIDKLVGFERSVQKLMLKKK